MRAGVEGTRPLAPQGQPLRLSLRIRANPRIIANLSAGRIHAPPTQKQTAARLARVTRGSASIHASRFASDHAMKTRTNRDAIP